MIDIKILYEDNHLIAVFKPAGILSQSDKSGDVSIFDEVKKYLKEKYNKPGRVFLGLLHRLDRPVSGIMLFAKTSKGASRLSEQFRNHAVEKTYHAIVLGKPSKSRGVLTNLLGKDIKSMKAREFADGKEVVLQYEVIKTYEDPTSLPPSHKASEGQGKLRGVNKVYALLKIKIEGGKFHQIRAQLSLAGLPILGDVKYLPSRLPAGRQGRQAEGKWDNSKAIALCATNLSFKKATEDTIVNLAIDLPKEWRNYI